MNITIIDWLKLAIAIMGGTGSALAVIAFLGKNFIAHNLNKNIEKFKTELLKNLEIAKADLQRDLAISSRQDIYKQELAMKQIDAAQDMWSLFENTSLSGGDSYIIQENYENSSKFSYENAKDFVDTFNAMFSKKAGLYISESTRIALHNFRNFIIKEMIEPYKNKNTEIQTINIAQKEKFKELRTAARLALRKEVGSEDITIANNEYTSVERLR